MGKHLTTTEELVGVRVLGGKNGTRRIGKVRRFVFHPKEKRVVGFLVRRPDLLWMFRRKDKFVSIDGYDVVDGRIVVKSTVEATDKGACAAMGLDWDACVLWIGLPVMTQKGSVLGRVGLVSFDRLTGKVYSLVSDAGSTANTLLGKREIPAEFIKGFRRGRGMELLNVGQEGSETAGAILGAVVVANEAEEILAEGGLAEKAGATTAVAMDKAQAAVDKAKPVVNKAARKTGEAVNKGAYATGKQFAASKKMISGFKREYKKERGVAKVSSKTTSGKAIASKTQPTNKQVPKKNMFLAFKEEFDKERRHK